MEPINHKKFLDEAEKLFRKCRQTPTLCMVPGCKCKAINSHVFQTEKILRPIAPANHLYCFEVNSFFNQNERFGFHWRGISQVLAFWGFCNHHDNQIFSSIEKMDDVDWFNTKSQFLLGYKTICRELYVKELAVKYYGALLEKYSLPKEIMDSILINKKGFEMGVNDSKRYKDFLERAIFNFNFSYFNFETYTLPFYLELCVASPVSVSYSKNIRNKDIFEADLPETNIIVIFPYKQKTYVIVGFAHGFENRWANEFVGILKTQDSALIYKSLSNLILFRLDFDCMSENLFCSIPEADLNGFLKEYEQNVKSKYFGLSTHINLFKHLSDPA